MPTTHTNEITQMIFEAAKSQVMVDLARTIERIAPSDLGIILVGERGSGKTWIARALHILSNRSHQRFFELHCAALPRDSMDERIFGFETVNDHDILVTHGIFDEANGGTLFIDDISKLPQQTQRQLILTLEHQALRRLNGRQEVNIDIRCIAALERKPSLLVEEGLLRKEMYFRLSPVIINIPPLRERKADIPPLVDQFLRALSVKGATTCFSMSPEAEGLCLAYDWPGNVRQLKNAIEYATMMCRDGVIQTEHLPLYVHGQTTAEILGSRLKSFYRRMQQRLTNAQIPSDGPQQYPDAIQQVTKDSMLGSNQNSGFSGRPSA